jgi:hypothetical protein
LDKKKVLDIENIEKEFDFFNEKISLLNNRLLALAMDYKHFINGSINENKIYALRDNIQYRLFSAKFHVELLLKHISNVEKHIEQGTKFQTQNSIPTIMNTGIYMQQITSLFDSFIYHTVSIFDYLGTITNYINSNQKEKTLMWTQLAKSVRDKSNSMSKTKFAKTIDEVDRKYVSKLYDYRADLIHRKADIGGYRVVHTVGNQEKVTSTFFTGKNLAQNFSKIKKLNIEYDTTIRFAAIWLLNESIEMITDILIALKHEIESKSTGDEPAMFYLHPESNEKLPISVNYWHENLYRKNEE